MTLTLTLPSNIEQRLQQEAKRQGLPADEYAVQLLNEHLPVQDKREELVAILQSWIDEEDGEEQRETGDYLITALDEDRPSERKLFPPELQDISW